MNDEVNEQWEKENKWSQDALDNFLWGDYDHSIHDPLSSIQGVIHGPKEIDPDQINYVQLLCLVQKWSKDEPWSERHILTEPLPETATIAEAVVALDKLYTETIVDGRRQYYIEILEAATFGIVMVRWGT